MGGMFGTRMTSRVCLDGKWFYPIYSGVSLEPLSDSGRPLDSMLTSFKVSLPLFIDFDKVLTVRGLFGIGI